MWFIHAHYAELKEGITVPFEKRKIYLTSILKYSNINIKTERGLNILQTSEGSDMTATVIEHIAIFKCTGKPVENHITNIINSDYSIIFEKCE